MLKRLFLNNVQKDLVLDSEFGVFLFEMANHMARYFDTERFRDVIRDALALAEEGYKQGDLDLDETPEGYAMYYAHLAFERNYGEDRVRSSKVAELHCS